MRDLAIKDDDLIVATHGRGFWVLDNITPLRQITDEVAKSGAFLFRPATAFNLAPGSEYGPPKPRDEALAENPPYGAMIDYYLRSAVSGPMTLEIHDTAGELIRRYSSDDRAPEVNPELLSVPAFWRRTPPPLSTTAGMHRWVWDLRPTPTGGGGRGGGGGSGRGIDTRVLPGRYSAKLIVEGKTYTQPLLVKADPRAR